MDALHVVGAGGIGCAVGYALLRAGIPVLFVETDIAKIEWGQKQGVQVNDFPAIRAPFVHFEDWQPGPTVLLCTKCYDNSAVLSRLPNDTQLIPIQNGFDSQLHKFKHRYEGIASFVAKCLPNRTHTQITRAGALHFGPRLRVRSGEPTVPRFWKALCQLTQKQRLFRIVEVDDILPIKYTKLLYNAAISPLSAAAGFDNGQLLSVPLARRLFFALLLENYRILRAAEIALGKVGPFHPTTVAWILQHNWLARFMAKVFEPGLRGTYCSMAGEIQKGRTELDNYTGHLLHLAAITNTHCPLNRAIYELVTNMTKSRANPSIQVFDRLSQCEYSLA
jgi:2-dehydropantoate 2-reductase